MPQPSRLHSNCYSACEELTLPAEECVLVEHKRCGCVLVCERTMMLTWVGCVYGYRMRNSKTATLWLKDTDRNERWKTYCKLQKDGLSSRNQKIQKEMCLNITKKRNNNKYCSHAKEGSYQKGCKPKITQTFSTMLGCHLICKWCEIWVLKQNHCSNQSY